MKNGDEVSLRAYELNRAANKHFRADASFFPGNRRDYNDTLVEWTAAFVQVVSILVSLRVCVCASLRSMLRRRLLMAMSVR